MRTHFAILAALALILASGRPAFAQLSVASARCSVYASWLSDASSAIGDENKALSALEKATSGNVTLAANVSPSSPAGLYLAALNSALFAQTAFATIVEADLPASQSALEQKVKGLRVTVHTQSEIYPLAGFRSASNDAREWLLDIYGIAKDLHQDLLDDYKTESGFYATLCPQKRGLFYIRPHFQK
jgi:hypothetical protein